MEIEYDLNFETKAEPVKVINAVSNHDPLREPNVEMQLQKTLDQMMKCMVSLEMKLQAGAEGASGVPYSWEPKGKQCEIFIDSTSLLGVW